MTEKPLHVRVAEALGCRAIHYPDDPPERWACTCKDYGHRFDGGADYVASYDTDWSATGPLIEKYEIDVWREHWTKDGVPGGVWIAGRAKDRTVDSPNYEIAYESANEGQGETPLAAVCNLILALAEAGRLEK